MCPDIGMCHLSPINNKFKVHNHFPCDDMILRTYRKVNKYIHFSIGSKGKLRKYTYHVSWWLFCSCHFQKEIGFNYQIVWPFKLFFWKMVVFTEKSCFFFSGHFKINGIFSTFHFYCISEYGSGKSVDVILRIIRFGCSFAWLMAARNTLPLD